MDRHDFLNRLKILRSLDQDELVAAGVFDAAVAAGYGEGITWQRFRDNPAAWLLQADDVSAGRLWALVEARG